MVRYRWKYNYTACVTIRDKNRIQYSLQNYNHLRIVDKLQFLSVTDKYVDQVSWSSRTIKSESLAIFFSNRQVSRHTILNAKFVLLWLHVPFVSSNLNAQSTQRVCSALVSAYSVCVLCLSFEVLCVNSNN